MSGSPQDVANALAAARTALGRGDRAEAEQLLRNAIDIAEQSADTRTELVTAVNALAALRRDMGDLNDAEVQFQRSLALLEGMTEPDELLMLATCTGLGGVLAARGEAAEAKRMLGRALSIGERRLGADHPDLGGLLNDLSRLLLKSGAYAAAEPLLLRLHELKVRSKGDEHPEVATVLASLASVREALGRHDEAETMWRRVLAVRERTLAPNHFATATALERLAESCAARGKVREALQLLERATTMRELTLGPTHPSLRVARDRIADLQLQWSDETVDGVGGRPPAQPAAQPQPQPAMQPAMQPASQPATPAAKQPELEPAVPTMRPAEQPTAPTAPAAPALARSEEANGVATQTSASHEELVAIQAERRELMAIQADYERLMAIEAKLAAAEESDEEAEEVARRANAQPLAAAALLIERRRVPVIVTGTLAAALLLGAGVVRSRAASAIGTPEESKAAVSAPSDAPGSDSAAAVSAPAPAAPAPLAAAGRDHVSAALDKARRPQSKPPRRDADVASSARQTQPIPFLTVAPRLLRNLDTLARSGSVPAVSAKESYPVQLSSDVQKPRFDPVAAESASELVRARLIGAPPQPRFPEILRDRGIEGEVLIRFVVDAQGRPDPTTVTVVHSPHDLLSNAVRRVIPTMRFEPAHRTGIGAAAEPDKIEMAFRFSGGTR